MAHLLALDGVQHELDARAWARVVRAIPREAWTDEDIVRAREVADRHDSALRFALLARAQEAGDDKARARLMAEANDGSLEALSALGDVREIGVEVITNQIRALAGYVTGLIADAHDGRHGIGAGDVGRDLILLNVWHPDAAVWDPMLEMLAAEVVIADHKRASLRLLGDMAKQVPPEIRQQLAPIALELARSDGAPGIFDNARSLRSEAMLLAAAIGALDDTQTAGHVLSLLGSDTVDRCRALALVDRIGVPEQIGILVALTGDPHPDVRAMAAALLARNVDQDHGGLLALEAVRSASHDPGTQVPAAVARTLRRAATPAAQEIRDSLRHHRSARVRRASREA